MEHRFLHIYSCWAVHFNWYWKFMHKIREIRKIYCLWGEIQVVYEQWKLVEKIPWRSLFWLESIILVHFTSTQTTALREKRPYSELCWSVFSCMRMRENADQNNSEYGHFYAVVTETESTICSSKYIKKSTARK